MFSKLRAVVKHICYVAKTDPAKLTLMKSAKNRSPKEQLQLQQMLYRITYCRQLIEQQGMQKFQLFMEHIYLLYEQSGVEVIRKGQQGTKFYIILKGCISLLIYKPRNTKAQRMMNDPNQINVPYDDPNMFQTIVLKDLKSGDHFGDMSLIDQSLASATCLTRTECEFMCMDKDNFWRLIGKGSSLLLKVDLLRQQSFLQGCEEAELKNLSHEFKARIFSQGQYIYHQGQPSNRVFLIQDGFVEISQQVNNKIYQICRIDQSQLFGDELQPLYSCNARCGSARLELLEIDKKILFKFFDRHQIQQDVFESQIECRKRWRESRQQTLEKSQTQIIPKLKNEMSGEFSIESNYKFKMLQSPNIRRISSYLDVLDLEQKKVMHKEVLMKLNKIPQSRECQFFQVCKNFKEKKRREQHQQTKFLHNLREYLSKNKIEEPVFDMRSIRTASQTGLRTMLSSPNQSPITKPKHRKQLSVQGLMLRR
ncbi:hypothetical protein pb186bvf_017641 [Paramecium bursaria]